MARKYSARLTLLHVLEHMTENILDERNRQLQAEKRLKEFAGLHEAVMDKTVSLVKRGDPADSILRTAVQESADLIVLGMRASQGMSDHLMWRNAYGNADCA